MFHSMTQATALRKSQERIVETKKNSESLASRCVEAYNKHKYKDMNYALEMYLEPAVRIVNKYKLDWTIILNSL